MTSPHSTETIRAKIEEVVAKFPGTTGPERVRLTVEYMRLKEELESCKHAG